MQCLHVVLGKSLPHKKQYMERATIVEHCLTRTSHLIYNKFSSARSLQQVSKIITEEIVSNKYTDHICGSFPDDYYMLFAFCEI